MDASSITKLISKRAEIINLSLNDSLTNNILIKLDDELKNLNYKRSKLMFDKVLKYNYSKNYSVLITNIKEAFIIKILL